MLELNVDRLQVAFGSIAVLHDIHATFLGGQVHAIIGVNGTGKSVFMKALAGLITGIRSHVAGTVRLQENGQELSSREIGYVPQMAASAISLTAYEMVLLGRVGDLGWRVPKEVLDRADELVTQLHLEDFSDKRFSTLSGGQKQLVIMAQALMASPRALLLDEPTSALDVRHQVQVLDIARKYTQESGACTLIAIHDLSLAARYADDILLLDNGSVRMQGSPEEVLRPDVLKEAYGVSVDVSRSSMGFLTVTPYSVQEVDTPESGDVCTTKRDAGGVNADNLYISPAQANDAHTDIVGTSDNSK